MFGYFNALLHSTRTARAGSPVLAAEAEKPRDRALPVGCVAEGVVPEAHCPAHSEVSEQPMLWTKMHLRQANKEK